MKTNICSVTRFSDNDIRKNWDEVISKIDKYCHPTINTMDDIVMRDFIVNNEKRAWVFDIISKLVGNVIDEYTWVPDYTKNFYPGANAKVEARTASDDNIYKCVTRKYINNNTHIIISITKK